MTDRTSKDETLDSWLKGCEEHIESGIATDLVAICPVALRRFIYELRERRAAETNSPLIKPGHPEEFCEKCRGRNARWFAPSELWNRVHGDWDILCPVCFIDLAYKAGIDPTAWELAPEVLGSQVKTNERLAEVVRSSEVVGGYDLDGAPMDKREHQPPDICEHGIPRRFCTAVHRSES